MLTMFFLLLFGILTNDLLVQRMEKDFLSPKWRGRGRGRGKGVKEKHDSLVDDPVKVHESVMAASGNLQTGHKEDGGRVGINLLSLMTIQFFLC